MPARTGTLELGLDLGSSYVRLVERGRGVVIEEPTVVAVHAGSGGRTPVAFGREAQQMTGRSPADVRIVRPVRGGTIQEYEATEFLVRHLLERLAHRGRRRPRVLVTVPTDATEVERRALIECVRSAGAREVVLVDGALSAGLGAQLPVTEPVGSMVVDVGGGRTEVAVLSLSGLVVHRTLRIAGDAMDKALVQWLRRHQDLMISEAAAERVKIDVGAARAPSRPRLVRVRGRDISSGAVKTFDTHGGHVAEAIAEAVGRIRDAVVEVLRDTPPELSADIRGSGVLLTGGGTLLPGLDDVLGEATGLPYLHAEHTERCAALGLVRLLDDERSYEQVVGVA